MNNILLSEINNIRRVMGLELISEAVAGVSPLYEALEKFFSRFGSRGMERAELEALEAALAKDANLVRDFEEIGTKLQNPATVNDAFTLMDKYLRDLNGFERVITVLERSAPSELNSVIDKTIKTKLSPLYDKLAEAYELAGTDGVMRVYDAITPQAQKSTRMRVLFEKWKPETSAKPSPGPRPGEGGGGGTSPGPRPGEGGGGGFGNLPPKFGIQDLINACKADPLFGEFMKKSGVESKLRTFINTEMRVNNVTASDLWNNPRSLENWFGRLQTAVDNGQIKTGGIWRKAGDILAAIPTSRTAKISAGIWVAGLLAGAWTFKETWAKIKSVIGSDKAAETQEPSPTQPTQPKKGGQWVDTDGDGEVDTWKVN